LRLVLAMHGCHYCREEGIAHITFDHHNVKVTYNGSRMLDACIRKC